MKLKSLLKESKVWERKFGEPLPTLEDTTKAYKLKQEDLVNEKVVNVGDRKYKLTSLNSIPKVEKLAYDGLVSYRGLGVFGANVYELSINNKTYHMSGVKQQKQYFISGSDLDKLKKKVDDSPFLAGQLPNSILLKGWRPIKPDDRKENGYQSGVVSNIK